MGDFKNKIIDGIIDREGGYVNDPADSGGETNYGITMKVARSHGYFGSMKDMPKEVAFDIYAEKYWHTVKGDDLAALSESICEEVVDTCVNMGSNRATIFLQRSLNVLNSNETYYSDLVVDGVFGNMTIAALVEYLSVRDEDVLVKMLNCLQGAFYVELAEKRQKDEKFIYGWFKNRIELGGHR